MIDILADVRLFVMQPVHIVGREDEDKSGTCHTRTPSSTLLKSWSKPFALAGLSTGNPMFIRQGGGSMKPVIQRIQEWAVGRYSWQLDAIRRVFEAGGYTAQDVEELELMCLYSKQVELPNVQLCYSHVR